MMRFASESILFSIENVICDQLVQTDAKHVKNSICNIFKQYIYRKRCYKQCPDINEIKQEIRKTKSIELYIATKNGQINKHTNKWCKNSISTELTQTESDFVQQYIFEM